MEKKLNEHREDLIIANERIEFASKALTIFDDDDFQSGRFEFDIGLIIQEESDKIQAIIGSYDEMAKDAKSGKTQE